MAMCQDDMDREIDTGQDDYDLYDAVEADHQLQGRLHISDPYPGEEETDSHVEVCTNCGAYHSRPTFRCATCEAL